MCLNDRFTELFYFATLTPCTGTLCTPLPRDLHLSTFKIQRGCHIAGDGQIDWHCLSTVFSSEMLKFEEEQRILDEAARAQAAQGPHTPLSNRGSGNLEQLSSPRGSHWGQCITISDTHTHTTQLLADYMSSQQQGHGRITRTAFA